MIIWSYRTVLTESVRGAVEGFLIAKAAIAVINESRSADKQEARSFWRIRHPLDA